VPYHLLWEAGVAEIDEADGGEGVHQLVCCLLDVRLVQLGIIRDRQRQRREINHWNLGHFEQTAA